MNQTRITFHDGNSIPQLGYGVGFVQQHETPELVRNAIEQGFRHVDTARGYRNEAEVGEGIRASGVKREEIFVTNKLWCEFQGYEATLASFDETLKAMGLDYLDLYLIHWPNPADNLYVDTWKAMIKLQKDGLIRSIGVSNFAPEHIDRLVDETGVKPVINQVELHPRFQQKALRTLMAERGIVTEAWGPLAHGIELLNDPVLVELAKKHGRSPAQIVIRWHLQNGVVVIPRSEKVEWMRENLQTFDFALDDADMAAIGTLDRPSETSSAAPYSTLKERMAGVAAVMEKIRAAAALAQ